MYDYGDDILIAYPQSHINVGHIKKKKLTRAALVLGTYATQTHLTGLLLKLSFACQHTNIPLPTTSQNMKKQFPVSRFFPLLEATNRPFIFLVDRYFSYLLIDTEQPPA